MAKFESTVMACYTLSANKTKVPYHMAY